jgi:hypothetical protein
MKLRIFWDVLPLSQLHYYMAVHPRKLYLIVYCFFSDKVINNIHIHDVFGNIMIYAVPLVTTLLDLGVHLQLLI